jgi:hypothetical protein
MVNRPDRQRDGYYHIKGQKYPNLVGSRRQVWNKTAYKTSGGLTRRYLMLNKKREIVSVVKNKTAKRGNHLGKYLKGAKDKGKFELVYK